MNHPAPGIHTLTLPLPWELETVNVHLVELDDGFLLVDSGLGDSECFDALELALRSGAAGREIRWNDIRLLLLTHLHPDHIGLSWTILELSGARLAMHRAEAQFLTQVMKDDRSPFFLEVMANAGVPAGMQGQIERALGDVRRHYRAHQTDWLLEGGERIPARGDTLEAVWTPGHSPGHVCLYSPRYRYLISGDHLLESITPNIGWQPNQDTLADYLDSLERLRPLDVDLILPSHGGPFRGHRERIRATTEHHAARCSEILAHIAKVPLTAHALVEQMWPAKLSAFHHYFAVSEILAHLDYMERRGRVASSAQDSGALNWTRA